MRVVDHAVVQRRSRRLAVVVAINVAVVVGQVAGGIAGHSLSLFADAGHNLTDVAAAGLSLAAVRLTRRAPTDSRSFGYHRSSVLAAQVNAAAILVVTALIAVGAVERIVHPVAVHGGVVVVVALAAVVANGLAAIAIREGGHRHDLNVASTFLHMAGDALASAGVAVGGLVILLDGRLRWVDPVVSLSIAVLIAFEALRLVREVTEVLLEATPAGLDRGALVDVMSGVAGVDAVHDLHIWSLSPEVRALSAHLVLSDHPSLAQAQGVAYRVKQAIGDPFAIAHATLELECEACFEGVADPCAMASDSTATNSTATDSGPPRALPEPAPQSLTSGGRLSVLTMAAAMPVPSRPIWARMRSGWPWGM